MITRENAKIELQKLFPILAEAGNAVLLDDYAVMAELLSSREALRRPLQELERKLVRNQQAQLEKEQPAYKKLWATSDYLGAALALFDSTPEGSGGLSKILTRELEGFERESGFVHGGRSGKADILVGQAGAEFNTQLEAARPFKDVGAGANHGEFSHRLQWYLAGTSGLLRTRASVLYATIPQVRAKVEGKMQYLWVWLLDRSPAGARVAGVDFGTPDIWDWRSPENLNGTLMKDEGMIRDYPVLSAVLLRRFQKRSNEQTLDYFVRKIPQDVRNAFFETNRLRKAELKKPHGGMFYQR